MPNTCEWLVSSVLVTDSLGMLPFVYALCDHVCVLLQRARQQRAEAKSRKTEAQRKNTKVQQISNPATIKKMMKDKKQRKKLMTADPDNAAKGHA